MTPVELRSAAMHPPRIANTAAADADTLANQHTAMQDDAERLPATQDADTERVRTKQPLDARTATKGLFGLGAAGNAPALKALFDDCVLIDHTAQGLDDCQPVPADLTRDEDGATALLPACEGGHVECVKLLLAHGCPAGKANREGRTPVMTACHRGHAACLVLLLEARASPYDGAMPDDDSESSATPIVMAIDHLKRSSEDACVRQLLRADERLRAPPGGASGGASSGADAAAARTIRAKADVYYATALTRACASGLTVGARLLLQACGPAVAGDLVGVGLALPLAGVDPRWLEAPLPCPPTHRGRIPHACVQCMSSACPVHVQCMSSACPVHVQWPEQARVDPNVPATGAAHFSAGAPSCRVV